MDPLTLGLGVVGLGLQLFGGIGQSQTAKQQAALAQQTAALSSGISYDEMQINQQKMMQTQMQARRMQLENARNGQRARAQATSAAVNQGAQFGSGLAGGKAQVTNEETFNALGINQSLQFANTVFGINNDISNKRMQIAGLQGQMSNLQGQSAEYQGLASLGGSIVKAGPIIGGFGKDLSAGLNFNSLFGGGSPSGYGA